MNELEYKIFAKALENAYSSVLLGEDQALAYIEHLVYLNRALADSPHYKWPLASEISLIQRTCQACWPEWGLEIRLGDGLSSSAQIIRGSLFRTVCGLLLEAEHGEAPDTLRLLQKGGSLEYQLILDKKIWRQGVFAHE